MNSYPEIVGIIAIFTASAAVLAFLGLLSRLTAFFRQESQIAEYVEARDRFSAKRLAIRQQHREQLMKLKDRLAAPRSSSSEDQALGEGDTEGNGLPVERDAEDEDDLSRFSKRVKDHPVEATAYLKSLLRPHVPA